MNKKSIGFGLALAALAATVFLWRGAAPPADSSEARRSDEPVRAPAPGDEPAALRLSGPDPTPSSDAQPASTNAASSPQGITLHGAVTDLLHRPIHFDELLCPNDQFHDGRLVELYWRGGNHSAQIDDEGNYTFTGLKPGDCSLRVRLCGYEPWDRSFELLESSEDHRLDIALEADTILRLRIVIELDDPSFAPRSIGELGSDAHLWASTIHGGVRREPAPDGLLAGGEGQAERDLATRRETTEEHGEQGSWVIRESIELRADPPVYAVVSIGNRVVQSKRIESMGEEVVFFLTLADFRSRLGGLRFQLVDENGRAPGQRGWCQLANVSQTATASRIFADPKSSSGSESASTPETGEVWLRDLLPGPLGIQISVPGYARVELETVVDPGVERDLGKIRLEPAVTIRGHVLNPDGTPAMGVDVRCGAVRETGDDLSPFSAQTKTTDSPGGFMFYDLTKGPHVLRADSATRGDLTSKPVRVSTEGGSVEGVVLQLLAAVSVIVKLEGSPGGHLMLRVDDDQGGIVEQQEASRARIAAFGEFSLVPGRYTARALLAGREIAAADFVATDKALRVTLVPH